MRDHALFHVAQKEDGKFVRVHKFRALRPVDAAGETASASDAMNKFYNTQFCAEDSPYEIFRQQEWELQIQIEERWEPQGVPRKFTHLPIVEHNNVWEFFESIGFEAARQ